MSGKRDIEKILDSLRGPRESFRAILEDKDKLLAKVCQYAEIIAKRKRLQPWSIIGDIFGHGSGVSAAIYELYREKESEPNQ